MTKTAREIRKELAAKNSEARALRRALKEAEKAELLSAKTALGEALATVVLRTVRKRCRPSFRL